MDSAEESGNDKRSEGCTMEETVKVTYHMPFVEAPIHHHTSRVHSFSIVYKHNIFYGVPLKVVMCRYIIYVQVHTLTIMSANVI